MPGLISSYPSLIRKSIYQRIERKGRTRNTFVRVTGTAEFPVTTNRRHYCSPTKTGSAYLLNGRWISAAPPSPHFVSCLRNSVRLQNPVKYAHVLCRANLRSTQTIQRPGGRARD